MNRKSFPAQFKAVAEDGTFEALVSIFGNVDAVGDRVVKGAFTKSLQEWKDSGDPIPVIFSHQWDNLDAHVGEVLEAEETDQGLRVKARLDIEDDYARKLWNKLKRRRIKEFSFAYDTEDEAKAEDGANELRELKLIEVGPTLKGVNPDTQLLAVKSIENDLNVSQSEAQKTFRNILDIMYGGSEEKTGEPDGKKFYGALSGSVEERQENIRAAVRERWGADDTWAYIVATYADRVVVSVESPNGVVFYEVPYSITDDAVTLGEATEVEITADVVRKARESLQKTGRVLSAKNEDSLRQAHDLIGSVLKQLEQASSSDEGGPKAEEPQGEGASAEEPEAKVGSVKSPLAVRLEAELLEAI